MTVSRATPTIHRNYQVRWKNFRGFRDTGWVTIRPLTILIGRNNSGKTSFLAPLLLLSQTFSSRDLVTPLVTKGPLIDVGSYSDLIYNYRKSDDLFFGLRFHTHKSKPGLKKIGSYPPGSIELTFQAGESPQGITLKRYSVYDVYLRKFLDRSRLTNGSYSATGVPFKRLRKDELRAVKKAGPINYFFSPTSVLSELLLERQDRISARKRFSESLTLYLSIVAIVASEFRSLFEDFSYIGPIRDKPKRYYELSAETPRTVGPRGENAPNLLRCRYSALSSKLKRWVRAFEFGDTVSCNPISDDLFSIEFKNKSGASRNIADVGFGASQVLPLIVQALAAKAGSLTLAEQPEIHLNPRLQCALADLFVEMTNSNHQVIVETHSEHFLLRLRRLVAMKKILPDQIALYFVEKHDSESSIREVPISANGHIPNEDWPAGFFEDTLRESLALASAQSGKNASAKSYAN